MLYLSSDTIYSRLHTDERVWMGLKDYYIIVICSLTRAIIVNVADLSSFTILRVLVLTQRNIRVRRGFRKDLKE